MEERDTKRRLLLDLIGSLDQLTEDSLPDLFLTIALNVFRTPR